MFRIKKILLFPYLTFENFNEPIMFCGLLIDTILRLAPPLGPKDQKKKNYNNVINIYTCVTGNNLSGIASHSVMRISCVCDVNVC